MSMRTDFETAIEELHTHIIAQGKAIQRLEQLMRAHFDITPKPSPLAREATAVKQISR